MRKKEGRRIMDKDNKERDKKKRNWKNEWRKEIIRTDGRINVKRGEQTKERKEREKERKMWSLK